MEDTRNVKIPNHHILPGVDHLLQRMFVSCKSVAAFVEALGKLLMYSIPFQVLPITVPILPENGPKTPFLYVPIFLNIKC